jgi:cytochrome c556
MKRGLLLAAIVLLFGPAFAADDPILQRQELMENMKDKAWRPIVGMSKGELGFDVAAVAEALTAMGEVTPAFGDLFPPGSESGHDTEALPEIWTDREGFDQKLADYDAVIEAASSAVPQSVEELQLTVKNIAGTCKGCHDLYRVDKD